MLKHIELNKTIPLLLLHFSQWLLIWETTINENFEGKNATEAFLKAKNIAGVMQLKISKNH